MDEWMADSVSERNKSTTTAMKKNDDKTKYKKTAIPMRKEQHKETFWWFVDRGGKKYESRI